MRKNIIKIAAFASLLGLFSCGENFLYKEPQGSISQAALENSQGVDLLVTSAYANFTENGWGATPFNWVFGSIYGGDANKGSDAGDQSVINEIETYKTISTNDYLSQKWDWVYKGVQRVDMALRVIEKAKSVDLTAENAKIRSGELKFLRAVFYFEGIKVFGSQWVAWVDETMTENDPLAYNGVDIWPNVIKDIDAAIADLPATQPEVGRVNVWAAKALKAKMLVQQGKFSEAKPILKDVLDNGITSNGLKYALEDNMYHNFDANYDNGAESIFAAQFSVDANNNGNPGFSLNYPHNVDSKLAPGGCCGFFQPSYELANSYQVTATGLPYLDNEYRAMASVSEYVGSKFVNRNVPVDPRLDFAIGRQGIPYKDWGVCFTDGYGIRDKGNGGIFLPKKHVYSKKEFADGTASTSKYDGWAPQSSLNMQYLSVRDMILLYAECLADNNELPAAMAQVNLIRARAAKVVNWPKMTDGTYAAQYAVAPYPSSHASFTDKATCIKAIRFERKLELAMEGQRGFDLFRWGGEYMAKEISDYVTYETKYIAKFVSASKLSAAKTTFPVPDTQILTKGNDASGKPYLQQNPVWK